MAEQKSDVEKRAEAFVAQLLTDEALQKPSDKAKPEEIVMELPPWFDEKLFNRGRDFYWRNMFAFFTSILLGLVAVFSVPSILKVLVGSRRSSSAYTAFRRYVSTINHTFSWLEHELKPGSTSWKSLYTVRCRHYRAGVASRLKGGDTVSQRDVALTQFGFIGFCFVKPDCFAIRQYNEGDWEAYNYFWRVQGYMIGLEDRYNICRETFEETRIVCQLILDQFYTPCLENPPEYFEHMTRVMVDGLWSANPTIDADALIYWTKYLANVPGYVYKEEERIAFVNKIKRLEKTPGAGVDSKELMLAAHWKAIGPLPKIPPRILRAKDYASIEKSPYYQPLNLKTRYRLAMTNLSVEFYSTFIGRVYLNLMLKINIFFIRYLPIIALVRYGIKEAYVNMFTEDPMDDTKPLPNETYQKKEKLPWYKSIWSLLW